MSEPIETLHRTVAHRDHATCSCGWRSQPVLMDAARLAAWHQAAVHETIDNPYLHAFLAPPDPGEDTEVATAFMARFQLRDRLVDEYAWAIPTEAVVRRLAELSPICELGAGTGYWAKLITDVGGLVLPVDARDPSRKRWFTVVRDDATTFDVPPEYTLMLCWPPRSAMADQALARYRGHHVIYVGEYGGCTADEAFHAQLAADWDLVEHLEIPQWETVHDAVRVYARRWKGLP